MAIWKGVIDTFIQDQDSPLLQYYLINELKTDITLTVPISIDDTVLHVSAGHGFVAGDILTIFQNNKYSQSIVKSVATNDITISIPMSKEYIAGAQIIRGKKELNINAITPVTALYIPRDSIIPIDISIVKITIQSASAQDDGKFGGIAELTNGIFFRHVNGTVANLGLYKSNYDFKMLGANVIYTDKAPAGQYSTEITWNLKDTFGQVIRLNPRQNDYLICKLQDDLSALIRFEISVLGSLTVGE